MKWIRLLAYSSLYVTKSNFKNQRNSTYSSLEISPIKAALKTKTQFGGIENEPPLKSLIVKFASKLQVTESLL